MHRFLAAAAALALSAAAFAQTTFSPATQQVQLLAPQLVAFSGSSGNFESLVLGITTGTPVTLATVGADGSLQIVTFTPGTAVSALDAARLLEAARQNLIVRGITTPTGPQLAASLMGGTVTGLSGTGPITGVLTGSATSPTPVTVRTDAAALQSGTAGANLTTAQLQAVRNALATGTAVTLTTSNGTGTAQNVTFTPTGRLSDLEVNQTLQLAAALLAQQGVLNPTAEQLRVALFGGTLLASSGTSVLVQGVLQGQARNTSDSRALNTSASPAVSTSASPTVSTSASPPASTSASPASPSVGATSSAGAPIGTIAPRGSAVIRPGAR
jgi:hypothetical protein